MSKNPIFNDLIVLCIFIPAILFLHGINPSDGLSLWPKLAFVPLLGMTMDSMVRFQFMAIGKPILSFELIMYAASWGVLQATFLTIKMADFTDRADVLTTVAIHFTIMTIGWLVLGRVPQGTDKQIEKQTRFGSRQEFDAYRKTHSFPRSEMISAGVMFAVGIASLIWHSAVLGLVFLAISPISLARGIEIYACPDWYTWCWIVAIALSVGAVMYLTMSGS